MKNFKGTPGPWGEYREGFSTVYIEAKLRDGVIQEVAACGPTEAGSEQQSANAHLIAAAPELLEALQEIVNGTTAFNSALEVEHEFDGVAMIENAKSAINKALGVE